MKSDDLNQIGQLMDDKLKLSEQRSETKLTDFGHQLMADIGKFMEDHLFPMIEEKADKEDLKNLATKDDINRIERKLDNSYAKVIDHDTKIKAIESTPTTARELKHAI